MRLRIKLSTMQIIALGFIIIIFIGACLLCLPFASTNGSVDFVDALFTATSATCVTGLVVMDTGTEWTLFGQIVILVMIQIGGLGFMTFAILFLRIFRRRFGLKNKEVMVESINTSNLARIVSITNKMLWGTLIFELSGAVLLAIRFVPEYGWGQGLWYGLFHSVSAFCNAGFDLLGVETPFISLVNYADDLLVNGVIMALIVIGGIGFLVWDDITKFGVRVKRYSLTSKIVLSFSAILIVGGALLMYLTEYAGKDTGLTFGQEVLRSLFASVTARTAGFNTINLSEMSEGGRLVTMLLMFIGGSPGSTAGGIKTTTFAVIFIYTFAGVSHKQSADVFGRRIPDGAFKRAVYVFFTNLLLVVAGTFVISCLNPDIRFSSVMFECFSAIGTVGLTVGITTELDTVSHIVLILLMYLGRVGSISFATVLFEKRARPAVVNPKERITIG
ncbi:MAG TPA: Trk family potassium uptake protein [Candidatus Limihabitans stercoravium]|nr:Trk family potassium uptake protein [Candidatus Limihabitans stercoravium]